MRKKSNRNIQWAGIDTRNLGARAGTNNLRAVPNEIKQQFYKDFGKVIKEWWSFSNNWIKVTRNGLKADANNGAYSIEMKADLTVWVGGAKKQFKLDDSLYEIILWVDQQTRNKFAKDNTMKDQFLREKIVRLAHSNPQLRKHLLPLVNGKVASDESLELRATKLAYANSELREHLVPLIKQASFFKEIMEKIKSTLFPNKETGNKVKFDSLPQEQKKEITEKAKEDAKKKQEKADESKEEEKSESKKEEKSESKSDKKPSGVSDRERPDISNPSSLSDEDLDTAIKSMKKDLDDVRGQLHLIHQGLGYPQAQQDFEKMEKEMSDKMKPLTDELGERDKAKAEKVEKEKKKKEEEAKKKREEAAAKEQARRDSLTPEERKKEDDEKEAKKKRDQENARMMEEYYMNEWNFKSSSLKSQLVRLAYQNPSLRADLLPLITKSAKGDYKKGDKIPPRAVYGSKESYDEKLKDGKIFVVLPRESKNSDPFMMYLTDSSLKVLKVLGTHPTMRGAKAWLKSQKGKLASTRVAKLRVGQTWESNTIRAHRYHDSIKVWDLKHAGKRGKKVEIMNIHITEWKKPNQDRAYLDDVSDFLTNTTTYDHFKKIVISFLKTAGFTNVVGNRESIISFREEKGVRISPPNMGKIVINNRFVSAWFELGEFHIQDKTDQNNLPTMMERDRRSPPKLYKMVAGNKAMFEKMNYKEMRQFLIDYKINFRTYMGMD